MNGNGRDGQISEKQEKSISALLACPTLAEAARKAKVGESTLRRWLKQDAFIEAYRQARRQASEQAQARIQAAMGEAVETLRTVMKDSGSPASARVSAARTVLDSAFKAIELDEIGKRLDALEERFQGGSSV